VAYARDTNAITSGDLDGNVMPAVYWRPVIHIIMPVLPVLRVDQVTLTELSQRLCVAQMYFDDNEDEGISLRSVFQVLGQRVHLNATAGAV